MNAMADAAAKCHLGGAREADDLRARVTSRPVLYVANSDFSSTGALRAQTKRAQVTGACSRGSSGDERHAGCTRIS